MAKLTGQQLIQKGGKFHSPGNFAEPENSTISNSKQIRML